MIVVGLTGSIAMGKSTVATMFAAEGVAVFDSDATVHAFYRSPGAAAVEAAFPGVFHDGAVDRDLLAQRALGDSGALARLESIVHPAVAQARREFIEQAAARGKGLVVLDVPLLFETRGERSVDVVVVVSADPAAQKERALGREGMTAERLEKILARQTPDAEKRRKAHWVIDTSRDRETTRAQVLGFLRSAAAMAGRKASAHA